MSGGAFASPFWEGLAVDLATLPSLLGVSYDDHTVTRLPDAAQTSVIEAGYDLVVCNCFDGHVYPQFFRLDAGAPLPHLVNATNHGLNTGMFSANDTNRNGPGGADSVTVRVVDTEVEQLDNTDGRPRTVGDTYLLGQQFGAGAWGIPVADHEAGTVVVDRVVNGDVMACVLPPGAPNRDGAAVRAALAFMPQLYDPDTYTLSAAAGQLVEDLMQWCVASGTLPVGTAASAVRTSVGGTAPTVGDTFRAAEQARQATRVDAGELAVPTAGAFAGGFLVSLVGLRGRVTRQRGDARPVEDDQGH